VTAWTLVILIELTASRDELKMFDRGIAAGHIFTSWPSTNKSVDGEPPASTRDTSVVQSEPSSGTFRWRWARQQSYSASGPVSTGMGDRLRAAYRYYCYQTPGRTQPPTLSGTVNEYQQKCGLGVKAGWFIPFVDKRHEQRNASVFARAKIYRA